MISFPQEPFYFVRHGRTDWSHEKLFEGSRSGNYSLNDHGKKDAAQAADIFFSTPSRYAIATSRLKRTQETAAIIAEKIQAEVLLFPDLRERYFGNFNTITAEEYFKGVLPEDAESKEEFAKRVSQAIPAALDQEALKGYTKILVSHALVFKALTKAITGHKEKIQFGEVVLFTPPKEEGSLWTITRVR